MKSLRYQALLCSGFVLLQFSVCFPWSLWSPQILIQSLGFCTSADAPSLIFNPKTGEQNEQCSCSPYPKGMVRSCYNISTLNLQPVGLLKKKNAIERMKQQHHTQLTESPANTND